MLVDRRRSDQDYARVMGHDLRMGDDLFQVGFVLVQRNVLLVGSTRKRGVVGAKKDGLRLSVRNRLSSVNPSYQKANLGLLRVRNNTGQYAECLASIVTAAKSQRFDTKLSVTGRYA